MIIIMIIALVVISFLIIKEQQPVDRLYIAFCLIAVITATTGITAFFFNYIKDDEKETVVKILNGDIKYDTISMDKHGKLLEIEIIK